ncbi:MAG: sigma-70 family RNA polymerase sigma factor [Bacteroidia bacterium]
MHFSVTAHHGFPSHPTAYMTDDLPYIRKVLAGDANAYGILVQKYQRYIFSLCLRILKNREEAEEAAQDTFLKAYRKLDTFQQTAKLSTWLYKIAWNTALDKLRAEKKSLTAIAEPEKEKIADSNLRGPAEMLQYDQNAALVQRFISLLPENESLVLTLYYLHECSVEEITGITGFSVSNVKVILFRGRNSLRVQMESALKKEIKEML